MSAVGGRGGGEGDGVDERINVRITTGRRKRPNMKQVRFLGSCLIQLNQVTQQTLSPLDQACGPRIPATITLLFASTAKQRYPRNRNIQHPVNKYTSALSTPRVPRTAPPENSSNPPD